MCGIAGIFKFDNNTVDEKILSNIFNFRDSVSEIETNAGAR